MKAKEGTTRRSVRLPIFLLAGLVVLGWGLSARPALAIDTCSDGILDYDEVCDDGNLTELDGCSSICQAEGTCSITTSAFCVTDEDCTAGDNDVCLPESCIDDVTGVTNNCTAEDVRLALVLNEEAAACEEGGTVDLELIGEIVAGANERWDIGFFIALDGGDARTGVCYHGFVDGVVPPLEPSPPECTGACKTAGICSSTNIACLLDTDCPETETCEGEGGGSLDACFKDADCGTGELCDGGYNPGGGLQQNQAGDVTNFLPGGPFYHGECSEDPDDTCGDLEQLVLNLYDFPVTLTVPCVNNVGTCATSGYACIVETGDGCTGQDICEADGKVDFGTCVSWDNSTSDGTENKPSCLTVRDTVPNTKAKCSCRTVNLGNVFIAGKVIIEKVCDPSMATQAFNFSSDFDFKDNPLVGQKGPDPTLSCGGSAESVALTPTEVEGTTYTVSEDAAPPGWYFSGEVCTSDKRVGTFDPTEINLLSAETVTCVFTNEKIAVDLTKSCDPLSKVGEDVDYTITVDNNSGAGAPDLECTIDDSLLGPVGTPFTLAPGASHTETPSRTVLESDPDPLGNTASVSCTFVGEAGEVASDADTCSTNLFQPTITFDKTGDALSKVGEDVSYTITLNNTSSTDAPDLECTITDEKLEIDKSVTLASGATDTTTATYTVLGTDPDPLVNTAEVDCSPIGFPNVLEADDGHSVQLFQPSITFDKTGDPLSKVGEDVSYTITLNNTSSTDTPDLECTITDAKLPINKSVTLVSGATDTTTATYTVLGTDPDPLVNTAEVDCSPIGFPNVLEADDGHSVQLFQPSITFNKTGDPLSKVGEDVSYTITLNNTSSTDTPNLECTITDGKLEIDKSVTLASGATDTTTATYTVLGTDPDPLVNTAEVDCSPIGFPNLLEASGSHSVQLFQPGFDIVKTGDTLAKVGDEVNYTFTLSNDSSADTPELTCTAVDSLLGLVFELAVLPTTSGTLYGSSVDGEIFTIDLSNGAGTLVGELDYDVSAIEYHSGQSFGQGDGASEGIEFNIATASTIGTSIATAGPYSAIEAANGVWYATTVGNPSSLHTVDNPFTGTWTAVDSTTIGPISGLAYDTSTDTMYGIAGGDLYTIDLGTGAPMAAGLTGIDAGSLQFGPDGKLYTVGVGGDDAGKLYRIDDPTTGANTLVGATGFSNVTGLTLAENLTVVHRARAVEAEDPDPLVNTVLASCSVAGFPNVLEAGDGHSVQLFQPTITFDKTGDALSKVGEDVSYTITLNNTSSTDAPDLECTITDEKLEIDKSVTLASGATDTTTATYTVLGTDPDPLVNTAEVDCSPIGFPNVLEADDGHSVQLFQPSITFDKTGDPLSKVGEDVSYTITLNNTSSTDTPDLECTITDAKLPINKSVTLVSGATDTTTATYTVLGTDPDPLVNTAEVDCSPIGFPNVLEADDGHSVQLFQPSITFDKTGDALSKVGEDVSYTITLNNTSSTDTPNLECTITDAKLPINKSVTLASGATDTTTATYTVLGTDPDPLVNTAEVDCSPIGFPNVLEADDGHSVQLFQPSITFDKTGDPLSKVGEDVSYTITLNNTSSTDTPDLECTITDAKLPINKSVTLVSGATDTTTATYTVLGTDPDPLVNTAEVDCSPIGFPNVLEADDGHSVQLFQPSITFDKTGDALSKVGEDVSYTITLNNTSSTDTPNLECTITDAKLPINKSVTLASGATDTTTATYTVLGTDPDPLVNTAEVDCSPIGFPNVLEADDGHSVQLFQPSITFDKTGDPLSKVGEDVSYTITLNNTSSTDTPNLECTITDAKLPINKSVTLASGATDTTTATYTVLGTDPDPLVNTAEVDCSPIGFPNVLEADDGHSVQLFQPSITFDKTGDPLSKVGEDVSYTITLNNTSSTDTPNLECTITDAKLPINKSVTLASGATDTTTATYTVLGTDPDPLVNTAEVDCSPIGFPNVLEADDGHSVQLFQPSITFDKTGDALSKVGEDVSYTITLNNTSSTDTPDLECTITDAKLPINKSVTLVSGATDTTTATYTVLGTDPDPLVNTAEVDCSPIGFPNVLEADDGHSVQLFNASINVVKTGDEYSKNWGGQADEITYIVTIYNTSSDDAPNLSLVSFSDTQVSGVTPPVECDDLLPGESCSFSYTYTPTVAQGAEATLENTANVLYSPDGYPNQITDSDGSNTWTVTLVHPSFTVAKTCTNEPVPQEGPATWDVVIANTGDVPLVITADDGIGTFTLADGASQTFEVSGAGPFAGQASVGNTVNASWVLPDDYGLPNTASASASDTCVVAGRAGVIKLTQGLPNEPPNLATTPWNFLLQDCGTDGCEKDDPIIDNVVSPPSSVEFNLDLVPIQFSTDQTYRVCEVLIPAAWTNTWEGDANDDGTPDTFIPFVPAVSDDPVVDPPGWSNVFDPLYSPPPDEWTNDERCVNFVVDAGATEVFRVNNEFPGGEPRTIGYWKNWNSCTGGGQALTAIANGGETPAERLAAGYALLDDVLQAPGITIGLLNMIADDDVFGCDDGTKNAVYLLDKRDLDKKKRAYDPAYALASQLLAAIANDTAGAWVCPVAGQAVINGQELLEGIGFEGADGFGKKIDEINGFTRQDANELAGILDSYNNGTLCAAP